MFVKLSFLTFVTVMLTGQWAHGQTSETCPTYDASKIKLVTFDCFAAMMAWEGKKHVITQ